MLQALGYGLLDQEGKQIPFGAKGLEKIDKIIDKEVNPELKKCHFTIACDVTNPLCGPKDAALYMDRKKAQIKIWLNRWNSGWKNMQMQ